MKRIFCLLLSILISICVLSSCGEKYSPDDAVRNACFDVYHDAEEEKGKLFGLVMREFVEDSFVEDSYGHEEYLWAVNYTVNDDIVFLNNSKVDIKYDNKTEDLVCVTLSENIDFELDTDDVAFSYIFSVNKSTQKVTPLVSVTTENGILQEDKTEYDPQLFMSVLYSSLEYWRENIEYLKNYVY